MMDFQIKRTSRHCHATERELQPGEMFFSDLVEEEGVLSRQDFCEEAWQGPSDDSIGWWRARIPETEGGRVYWAPRDVLLAYFDSIVEKTDQAATTYVMGLLLVRKRILQLIDSETTDSGEFLELKYAKEKRTYKVLVVDLSDEQVNEIQRELGDQLFTDQPPD